MENIEERMAQIKERIASYALKDIFNFDETGLQPNLSPDSTIARHQIEDIMNHQDKRLIIGAKKSKNRLTIALTCNADGSETIPPFIIGHSEKPRCFKKKTGQELGFFYRSNKKAWMTGLLYQEYLQ